MGILATTMRLMELTNLEQDLSVKRMEKSREMHILTSQITEMREFCSDLDPNDVTVRQMEVERERLNERERILKEEQAALEAQMQEVSQELQACKQYLSQTIQTSGFFSYGLGGR